MNEQSNISAWIIGIVVVVLIAAGIWWVWGRPAANEPSTSTTGTEQQATTTQPTTGAGAAVGTESRSGSTVADVAASIGATSFASLLNSTGVSASLTGKGPYTVFVPENAAYAASAATINAMTAAQKKRLAQYHVVSGKQLDIDAVSAGNYVALSKDSLNFNVRMQDKSAFVNSAYVIRQYKASNGVVYLIGGSALIPPQAASSTTGSTGSPVPR